MDVDTFLKSNDDLVDSIMGTKSMVVDGQTFNVVWNDAAEAQEGAFGGLEGDIKASAVAQAADVTTPYGLLGKRCTIGGVSYRVAEVRAGAVAVTFALGDVNETR